MSTPPTSSAAPRFAVDLTGARCVVTGGLGFIGSGVVHRLVDLGASVVVVDSLVSEHGGSRDNVVGLHDVEVLVADIGDPDVADAVRGVDVVFNVAGQVSHLASMQMPMRDLDLNVRSHLAFLETVRRVAPAATVVQTSTRQVYGRPQYLPVDEEHPTAPVDVNGIDKLACEQFHLLYGRRYDIPVVVLRLTNVYGPRQHLEREGLGFLPVFIRQALEGGDIVLYGDGTQRRDCVYVDDVVEALLLSATMPEAAGEIFNLGHQDSLTLAEIGRLTQAAAGRGGSVSCVPWPDELLSIDIGSFQGDFAKAKRVLGWSPDVSFADGIADTIRHYVDRSWSPSST
ncbi:MAG: NAD-dependent epimerase/dehydratase family protein [Ilumatobacteraceae bacterium]